MRTKNILFMIAIPVLFTIAVYGSFVFDHHFTKKEIEHDLNKASAHFTENFTSITSEVESLLEDLKEPVECNYELFYNLIYEFKYIKNIGVLKDNTIACDAYQGSDKESKITSKIYEVKSPKGVIKYWYNDEYFSIAMPNGYFIEINTTHFIDFDISKSVSGLALISRLSQEVWFSYFPQNISQQKKKAVLEQAKTQYQMMLNDDSIAGTVNQIDDYYIKVQFANTGSAYAIFADVNFYRPFNKVMIINLSWGIIVGAILTLLFLLLHRNAFSMKNKLARDIKAKKLFMVYQPLVDLKNQKKLVGFESLVRWRNDNDEMIRPDIFIPIAEQNNLTKQLTHLIIELVFADLHEILKDHPELYVGINITPSDLHDDSMANHLRQKLKQYDLSPNNIVIELTERIVADQRALVGINELKKIGFQISIDDFGTGASNVKYLGELNPDVIKVDRSFVVWSDTDGPTSKLLEQLISIGKNFEVKVVTEGVETPEQASRCNEHGADVGQGYFWHKPQPIKDIKELLASKIYDK